MMGCRRTRSRRSAVSASQRRLLACCSSLLILVILLTLPNQVGGPAAPTSILFVGDSLTLGLSAVDPAHSYEQLLLDRLQKLRPIEWAASVIEHPYGLTDNAELRAAPYLGGRPRTIVVEVGTHEVHAPPEQQALFQQRYAHLLDRLAETHARVIVGTIPWLGYAPADGGYQEALRINSIIRSEAARHGDVVVDLWHPTVGDAAILSTPSQSTFMPPFQGDYFHPGNLGHEILANSFWPVLRQVEQESGSQTASGVPPFVLPAALGLPVALPEGEDGSEA